MEKELTSWLIRLRSIVQYLTVSGDWTIRARARLEFELEAALQSALMDQFRERVSEDQFNKIMDRVFERSLSPLEAVNMLMNGSLK